MNKEYLNVIVADHDEGNLVCFKDILKDLKIEVKIQMFWSGTELMGYLKNKNNIVPEVLFMAYNLAEKNAVECLEEIKSDERFNNMVNVFYSDHFSDLEMDEIFVKGANVCLKRPEEYKAFKKVLTEVITVNWQYHTSGMNKDNFIMKVG
ncbi:response regulator [Chryseobacterium daecheongense]|uniref:Response regulator n=1 Tax=Chryseobacterium daecheongense TaxID=192389 RepID=A0A3N0VXJ1_9FLAO|nr:response regulator [Chryseobacterium daecheongense]ROH97511.1 response regulator [Chryseobacterium daecheongense]TDX93339.1 response regulator receiver domain-containing protein [Chryseobacterium daecheongense]